MRLGTTATLINRSNVSKLVTLSVGPQLTPGWTVNPDRTPGCLGLYSNAEGRMQNAES